MKLEVIRITQYSLGRTRKFAPKAAWIYESYCNRLDQGRPERIENYSPNGWRVQKISVDGCEAVCNHEPQESSRIDSTSAPALL